MTFTSADANMTDSATALVFKKRERERENMCVGEAVISHSAFILL